MKGRIWNILTIVLILGLAVAACKPAAAPTATPVPTKPPATATPVPPTPTKPPVAEYEDEWGVIEVEKGDTVKVGFAAALSGAGVDVLGLDELRGVELAMKDKSEIKGFKVELVADDEMCSAEGGQTVANKFVANPQIVAVVGHMCSSSCIPASKIYEQHHYSMVSPSCTGISLTVPDADATEIFNRVCWSDKIQGPAAAEFAKDVLGVNKIATIHDGSPYAEQLALKFGESFEEMGGEVVAREAVNVGDTDMRPVLTRVKGGGPELIYAPIFPAEGGYLAAQRADVGMEDVIFMGADGIMADVFIEAGGAQAEGAYASAGDFAEAGPALPAFLAAYKAEYGEDPIAPFHAHAYDAYMVIVNAVEKVAEVDADGNLLIGRKKVRDAIRATKGYQGLSGKITCDANGDCGSGSVSFSMVKDGAWVSAAAPAPAVVGKVVVGNNAEYPPFEFVDEAGNIVGFDADLMAAIAEAAGFEFELVNTRWDGIFVALASGEFDAVCSAATITEERAETVDFSDPYFNAGQMIAVRADETAIKTDADLAGKKVGVQLGTTGDIWLTEQTQAEVVRYDENTLAFQALAAGDVDAAVCDGPTALDIVKANPEMNLMVLPGVYTDENYGIAVRKDRPEVLAAINQGLAAVKASGKYDEIYNKWFGAPAAPPAEEAKCVLKAVEKVDDYTVRFTFYRPHAPFLAQLASAMMPMVSPAAVQKNLENSFKTPVGTGPMKFVEWIPEDTITIVRNEDYWGEKAKLDKMIFRVIKDDPARLLELQTGTIDGADSIRPDDIPVVEADPNLALYIRPAFTIGYLGMNTDREPFNKLEVRQAVNYAIDKQAIVDAIAPKTAVTAKEYLPPLMWGYNDEVVDYEYNPEKAKELLAQAGYAEGFELYLWYLPVRRSYFPEALLIAQIMQKQLQNIGINCHLVTYDWGTYLYKIRHDEADLWMGGWMSDFGDPDNNLYTFFGGTTNSWADGPPDQELFDLLIEAKAEPDVAKRTELYHQANQRTHDIALGVPVMHNAGAFAAKKEVKGVVPDPFYMENWWNLETSSGTFIWGRAGDAVGLDAWDETDGESFMVTNQVFEGLYAREQGKTDIVPRLADGMPEVSADGLVWTIKLKEGIEFHDGTEFNADAVVFNIERAWDPSNPYRSTAHTNEYVYFGDFFGGFKGD